jgi:sulfur-carrier protein
MAEGPGAAHGRAPEIHQTPPSSGPVTNGAPAAEVTVLFFAGAREATGTPRARFRSGTVAELIDQLRSAYGAQLDLVLPTCAVWVNGSPAALGTTLDEGDEVAVLPPISGGCGPLGTSRSEDEKDAR